MRVLVCGGRDFKDNVKVADVLNKLDIDVIISGEAKGADTLAKDYARQTGYVYEGYPADWEKHGKSAGFIRNKQMLESNPDLVVAFPGGRGTANMVSIAKEAGVEVYEVS